MTRSGFEVGSGAYLGTRPGTGSAVGEGFGSGVTLKFYE